MTYTHTHPWTHKQSEREGDGEKIWMFVYVHRKWSKIMMNEQTTMQTQNQTVRTV